MKYSPPLWILALLVLVPYGVGCQSTPETAATPATQETAPAQDAEPTALPRTASPEGASAYIISPTDGATVEAGEVTVVFGLRGMGVAPAGIDFPDTGHHHLLVNVETMPSVEVPIPADASHIHFGKGQTETTLTLDPGTYTLQLLLGDRNHVPHDPPVRSETVTITVE